MNILGLNRNFLRIILFAGPDYFELGAMELAVEKGRRKIELFMGHVRRNNQTGKLILIATDYLEPLGKGRFPVEFPQDINCLHAPIGWLTIICETLQKAGEQLVLNKKTVVRDQRVNDKFLMMIVNSTKFQRYRMYMNVVTLADICDIEGDITIHE